MGARDAASGSPGSGLPAPYRNPWRNLADDLRAVVADLRLRLWRQWRRNRDGGLWRPSGWPDDLAPLFWPLSLALVLALLVVLTPALLLNRRATGPAAPAAPAADVAAPAGQIVPAAEVTGGTVSGIVARQPAVATAVPTAAPTAEVPQIPDLVPTEPAPPEPASAQSASPQRVSIDPLQLLLRDAPAAELLAGGAAEPASGTLVLQIQPAFMALGTAQRQQRAEAWQLFARELGFDHLELRDGTGGLLARDALVGSGMIVLPAPPTP